MTPDFDRAATAAMEILIDQNVTETPIPSLQILLHFKNIRVMSFSSMAYNSEIDRKDLVPLFGENQDAVTFRLTGMSGVD